MGPPKFLGKIFQTTQDRDELKQELEIYIGQHEQRNQTVIESLKQQLNFTKMQLQSLKKQKVLEHEKKSDL